MWPNFFLKARTGFIEGLAYVERDHYKSTMQIWKVARFVSEQSQLQASLIAKYETVNNR